MSAADLRVVEDPVAECAAAIVEAASAGGHIVLAGGSTPKAAYGVAAQQPHAFENATLWFGDERCVPPDDERSNYLMVQNSLLTALAAAGVRPVCHRIPGEGGPGVAALAYERQLGSAFGGREPAFDLVLLGVGPDGHTASLFPGQQELWHAHRLFVGVPQANVEPFVPRVTITFPAIGRSARVVVLATGPAKAGPIARAFGPDATPTPDVPASLLPAAVTPGALTVFLDAAAAEYV